MKKGVALVFAALIFIAGCASPEKEMKPFVGRPSSELLQAWGAPDIKTNDKDGGEIWTYTQRHHYVSPAYARSHVEYNNVGRGGQTATVTYEVTPSKDYSSTTLKSFHIGTNGVINKCEWFRQ